MRFLSTSIVRLVLAGLLLWNTAAASAAESSLWENRRRALASAERAARPITPAPALEFDEPAAAPLPAEAGVSGLLAGVPLPSVSVGEVFNGDPGRPRILLFTDVHLNGEAQRNTAAAIDALVRARRVRTVALEGAFAPIDAAFFAAFPDAAVRRRVADAYLASGRLGAASYLAADGRPTLQLVGVDDRNAYAENIRAYLSARARAGRVRDALAATAARLESDLAAHLPPAALEIHRWRTAERENRMSLGDRAAAVASRDLSPSATLTSFVETVRLERRLDLGQAERERARVLDRLLPALSGPEARRAAALTIAYRAGRVSIGTYYAALEGWARAHRVPLDHAPAFSMYLRYVRDAERLNGDAVLAALAASEERILDRSGMTPGARALFDRAERVALARKMTAFGLTPAEWAAYRTLDGPREADLAPFDAFYAAADRRSASIAAGVLSAASTSPERTAALVVGGFHVPALERALRAANVSYAVLSPKLTRAAADGSAYLSVFAREKTAIDRLFVGEALFVNPTITTLEDPRTLLELEAGMSARVGAAAGEASPRVTVPVRNRALTVVDDKAADPSEDRLRTAEAETSVNGSGRRSFLRAAAIFDGWAKRRFGEDSAERLLLTILGSNWEIVFSWLAAAARQTAVNELLPIDPWTATVIGAAVGLWLFTIAHYDRYGWDMSIPFVVGAVNVSPFFFDQLSFGEATFLSICFHTMYNSAALAVESYWKSWQTRPVRPFSFEDLSDPRAFAAARRALEGLRDASTDEFGFVTDAVRGWRTYIGVSRLGRDLVKLQRYRARRDVSRWLPADPPARELFERALRSAEVEEPEASPREVVNQGAADRRREQNAIIDRALRHLTGGQDENDYRQMARERAQSYWGLSRREFKAVDALIRRQATPEQTRRYGQFLPVARSARGPMRTWWTDNIAYTAEAMKGPRPRGLPWWAYRYQFEFLRTLEGRLEQQRLAAIFEGNLARQARARRPAPPPAAAGPAPLSPNAPPAEAAPAAPPKAAAPRPAPAPPAEDEIGGNHVRADGRGHRINGGKSRGQSAPREIIVVDRDRDPTLRAFIDEVLDASGLRDAENRAGQDRGDLVRLIYDAVNRIVGYDHYNMGRNWKPNEEVLLGEVLEQRLGVCRHMGLIVASVLEKAIEEGLLRGRVFYGRANGHGWAIYVTSSGERWVLDVAQSNFINMDDPDALYFGKGGLFRYGDQFDQMMGTMELSDPGSFSSIAGRTIIASDRDKHEVAGEILNRMKRREAEARLMARRRTVTPNGDHRILLAALRRLFGASDHAGKRFSRMHTLTGELYYLDDRPVFEVERKDDRSVAVTPRDGIAVSYTPDGSRIILEDTQVAEDSILLAAHVPGPTVMSADDIKTWFLSHSGTMGKTTWSHRTTDDGSISWTAPDRKGIDTKGVTGMARSSGGIYVRCVDRFGDDHLLFFPHYRSFIVVTQPVDDDVRRQLDAREQPGHTQVAAPVGGLMIWLRTAVLRRWTNLAGRHYDRRVAPLLENGFAAAVAIAAGALLFAFTGRLDAAVRAGHAIGWAAYFAGHLPDAGRDARAPARLAWAAALSIASGSLALAPLDGAARVFLLTGVPLVLHAALNRALAARSPAERLLDLLSDYDRHGDAVRLEREVARLFLSDDDLVSLGVGDPDAFRRNGPIDPAALVEALRAALARRRTDGRISAAEAERLTPILSALLAIALTPGERARVVAPLADLDEAGEDGRLFDTYEWLPPVDPERAIAAAVSRHEAARRASQAVGDLTIVAPPGVDLVRLRQAALDAGGGPSVTLVSASGLLTAWQLIRRSHPNGTDAEAAAAAASRLNRFRVPAGAAIPPRFFAADAFPVDSAFAAALRRAFELDILVDAVSAVRVPSTALDAFDSLRSLLASA